MDKCREEFERANAGSCLRICDHDGEYEDVALQCKYEGWLQAWPILKLKFINEFISEVNRRAENNMLKTGKLEGSHYAAMTQLHKEMQE